jgi:hypothetical protein
MTALEEARTVIRGMSELRDGVCSGEPVACGAMACLVCCAVLSLFVPGLLRIQATLRGEMWEMRDIFMSECGPCNWRILELWECSGR